MTNPQRLRFFSTQVHMGAWKNGMSGKNESPCITLLGSLGYRLGHDYVRQHPIGDKFVIDFAFLNEQIALEVDGKSHESKKQIKKDHARDLFLRRNNWVSIRIPDKKLFNPSQGVYYKYLIDEIVKERRKQYDAGRLYPLDIKAFIDEDYE